MISTYPPESCILVEDVHLLHFFFEMLILVCCTDFSDASVCEENIQNGVYIDDIYSS
jgi:hypothetical protein